MRTTISLLLILGPAAAAAIADTPRIERVFVNGQLAWSLRDGKVVLDRLAARPGDLIIVEGRNFGDEGLTGFSQVTVNRAAPLKTDVHFHRHHIDRLSFQQTVDTTHVQETQPRELLSWSDTRIAFRLPQYATTGPLVVTVQPKLGPAASLLDGRPLRYEPEYVTVADGKTGRPPSITVHDLGKPVDSNAVPVTVLGQEDNIRRGRELFFYWPQYSQVAYALAEAGLEKMVAGELTDLDGQPLEAGATGWIRWQDGQVYTDGERGRTGRWVIRRLLGPTPASQPVRFDNAYRHVLFPLLDRVPAELPRVTVHSQPTEWIGLVQAEFPNALNGRITQAIGVTCAACHTSTIEYPTRLGRVSEIVVGLPNLAMDFHRGFQHVRPNRTAERDLRRVWAAYGPGMLDFTSAHEDDGQFNPVAIGSHFGREALQRLSTGGLEGSIHHRNHMAYIHHGGLGRPTLEQSIALQTYINSLQADQERLRRLGLYNYLEDQLRNGSRPRNRHHTSQPGDAADPALADIVREVVGRGSAEEFETFFSNPPEHDAVRYPKLSAALAAGRSVFQKRCVNCHTPSLGLYTSQRIIPLNRIGTFLPPSDRMLKTQGIRVAPLTQIYYRGQAGYLHDNHIRRLDDQFNPDRGRVGSPLHRQYYEIGPDTPRIRVETPAQRSSVERFRYFVPETTADGTTRRYVYDYRRLLTEFGFLEYGQPVELPEVPHPYWVSDPDERRWLVLFLNSL